MRNFRELWLFAKNALFAKAEERLQMCVKYIIFAAAEENLKKPVKSNGQIIALSLYNSLA